MRRPCVSLKRGTHRITVSDQSFDLIRMFACASALLMAEIWRPNASRVFLSAWALLMLRSHRQRLPVFVTTRRISSREC